ncbi:MAG: hypothetical protein ACFCU6_13530 [Balneolaceae bacterium]
MKLKVLLPFLLFIFYQLPFVFAQQPLETTTQKSIQTPEVASLGNYGDIPVNLYTGTPNISIPLYTVNSSIINLPISINYNASGVRVDDRAGIVGLGWSLSAGGVITRTMQSAPDDKYKCTPSGDSNANVQNIYHNVIDNAWLSFEQVIQGYNPIAPLLSDEDRDLSDLVMKDNNRRNEYDTKPDIFSFNFGAFSGKFLLDNTFSNGDIVSGESILISDDDLVIKWFRTGPTITKFEISDNDGRKYIFDIVEDVKVKTSIYKKSLGDWQHDPESVYCYNTSWFLSKITSPISDETIDFSYIQHEKEEKTPGSGYILESHFGQTQYSASKQQFIFKSYLLEEIKTEGKKIVFNYNDPESTGISDITFSNKTLYNISIFNNTENSIKGWDFKYDYFLSGNDIHSDPLINNVPRQAKLIEIQEVLSNLTSNDDIPPFRFEYDNNMLPTNYDIHSFNSSNWDKYFSNAAVDYWGFHNGKTSNNNNDFHDSKRLRIPNLPARMSTGSGFNWLFSDLTPNNVAIKNGILKKIVYPTGGYTTLEYEIHDFSWVDTENLNDTVLGHEVEKMVNPTSTTMVGSSLWSEPTEFEIENESEIFLYLTVRLINHSLPSPTPTANGHGVARIHKITTGGEELSYWADLILPLHSNISSITTKRPIYEVDHPNYEPIILQPGIYRLSVELTCCDDNSNFINKEDQFSVDSQVFYSDVSEVPQPDIVTFSHDQIVFSLGNIYSRESADLTNYRNSEGGGLRLKKITSVKDENDNNPVIRRFIYKESDTNGDYSNRSSGVLVRDTQFLERSIIMTPDGNAGLIQRIETDSFLPLSTTHGSVVGYREVTELLGENGEYGKIRRIYASPLEIPDVFERIYDSAKGVYNILAITQDWARGTELKTEFYSADNKLISSIEQQYEFNVNTEKEKMYPGVDVRSLQTEIIADCSGNDFCTPQIMFMYGTVTMNTSGAINVRQEITKEYNNSDSSILSKIINYEYYGYTNNIKLPRKITETNSNGQKRVTEYVYAHEVYEAMTDKNMLAQPYSVSIKDESGNVLQKHWTIWNNSDGFWRPRCQVAWDGLTNPDTYNPTTCP